ncbi:MAG TPA: endo-1,4-beta-xylanase [Candidatus Saccharibacteria bacterium]|nr:endo-1,4-beta-xylanase [Candidatus Saccharibacteria bacterium]
MSTFKKICIALSVLLVVVVCGGVGYMIFHNPDPYTTKAAPQLPNPPLKELAERRGIQVGSFASLKYLRERAYTDILASEFEYAIIDGEPNWRFEDHTLRPSKDRFDFKDMDAVFDFADQNDMPVRVQHMLWGDDKWLPEWLTKGNFSRAELLDIIHTHIKTLGTRYKGKVREYTVVNEAFSRELETGGNKDWWGKQLGREYIDNAFIWAREADPNAVLILNDFGNETEGDISNLMYEYIKDAKSRGIPIDAIGMQMHISSVNNPSTEKVVSNMRRFADLGLNVYITEFDVNMHDSKGSDKEKERRQAEIYADMLKACLQVGPKTCPNFGFLGLVDRQSWYNGIGLDDADPLLFRSDYTPKQAFFAVRETLQDYKPTSRSR